MTSRVVAWPGVARRTTNVTLVGLPLRDTVTGPVPPRWPTKLPRLAQEPRRQVFNSCFSSLRKRQSVPRLMSWSGPDLTKPISCSRSA